MNEIRAEHNLNGASLGLGIRANAVVISRVNVLSLEQVRLQ